MGDFAEQGLDVPFSPQGGVSLSCSTSSARVALSGSGPHIVITNPDDVAVYVEFGDSTVVATVASKCILPGTEVLYTLPQLTRTGRRDPVRADYIAAITRSSTAIIQASVGTGR